jgi:A/G-specific adenine glycosylase
MYKKDRNFTIILLHWDKELNNRSMPWKGEQDPYKVWLSEIILQQTRVEQGLAYYQNFILAYPNVEALASAPEDDVMKLWQGLGYYSRARNLHFTAQNIVENYGGNFPGSYKELINLKGVGAYTAAAIASFVFKEKVAVVDGNVIRVISRYFGIEEAFDTAAGKKLFVAKANELISSDEPARFNQAIMDFGATICKPKLPLCVTCPLQNSCTALKQNKVSELPFKSKKLKVQKRYFISYLIETKAGFPVRKRLESDIWRALFELPLVEVREYEKRIGQQIVEAFSGFIKGQDFDIQEFSEIFEQKLTHQLIHVIFVRVKPARDLKLSKEYVYSLNLSKFAFPKVFILYLRSKGLILD